MTSGTVSAIAPPHPDGVRLLHGSGSESAPSSNTGCVSPERSERTRPTALVDFLSFTALIASLPLLPDKVLPLRVDGLSPLTFGWEPQTILDFCLPHAGLVACAFKERGRFGYERTAEILAPGVGPVGFILAGGNNGTFMVSISGAGCPFIGHAEDAREYLERIKATITRVDVAFDDLTGEFLDLEFLIHLARTGYFDGQGTRARKLIDDLGTLAGRSLYVGRKGTKELCVYEKGKQLQSYNSLWRRAEVRIWANNRVIPYDILTRPGSYLRGEYPEISSFLPAFAPARSRVMRANVEASFEAATRWMQNAAGKTLNLMRQSCEVAGVSFEDFVLSLSRDGIPKRFASVPDFVAIPRIAHKMKEATS